jgi:beta-alanine degradation protein BauB
MLRLASIAVTVALTACASAPPPAPAEAALPTAFDAGWKGEAVCERLFENDDIRVGRCSFPPGVGHERHFHPPHWGYILQGSTMQTTNAQGTTTRVLESGTTWWSDGVDWHEVLNVGETDGVYLIIEPKGQE